MIVIDVAVIVVVVVVVGVVVVVILRDGSSSGSGVMISSAAILLVPGAVVATAVGPAAFTVRTHMRTTPNTRPQQNSSIGQGSVARPTSSKLLMS